MREITPKKPSPEMFQAVTTLPPKQSRRKAGVDPIIDAFIQYRRPAVEDSMIELDMEKIPKECIGRQTADMLKHDPRPLQVRIASLITARWGDNKPIGTTIRDGKMFMYWTMGEVAIKNLPHITPFPVETKSPVENAPTKIEVKNPPKDPLKKSTKRL